MSVQQFCLRWNNHQPNFISVFSSLLHNETLVDVTLAAEGRQLQAHKVVLSACSSYFQSLFTSNPCQHPIVILKDVQYNDLKTMVDFMYYGEVNVSQEQLPQILKTAEMLKIKGLAEMPDAASLTKSESKSSSDHTENIPQVGGTESIWGSSESQQQFHIQQSRRTPSPGTISPSARRKRLRKSSTGSGSASTERTSEEQGSIDGNSAINIAQIDTMSSFNSGNVNQNISNIRILKASSSTDTEPPQQDSSQESIEETTHPEHSNMKTESDLGNMTHSMPIEITGSSTSIEGNTSSASCSQSQSQHTGVQWTVVDSNYPRFALSSCQANLGLHQGQNNPENLQSSSNTNTNNTPTNSNSQTSANIQMPYQSSSYSPQIISVNPNTISNNYPTSLSTPTSPQTSDSIAQSVYNQATPNQSPVSVNNSGNQTGPVKRKRSVNPQGDENFLRALDAVRFGGIGFCKAARLYGVNNRTLWLEYKKRGYPISRQSIKNRIKTEPNMSPQPPTTPTHEENTMENYDHMQTSSINMTVGPSETPSTPLMCPPHAHPMGVMSFLDSRHIEFPTNIHQMSRQRYSDGNVNVNQAAMNLQGLNFNSM